MNNTYHRCNKYKDDVLIEVDYNNPEFKHFKTSEILNPTFDDCPFNTWKEVPKTLKISLCHVMVVVDYIRDKLGIPLKLNSTYRIHDKKASSPHKQGKAIDFVPAIFPHPKDWAKQVIKILKEQEIFYYIRTYWEYQGNNEGWIHLDRNMIYNSPPVFFVGYEKAKGIMDYEVYSGKAPMEY